MIHKLIVLIGGVFLISGCQLQAPLVFSSETQPQVAIGMGGIPVLSDVQGVYRFNWSTLFWDVPRNGFNHFVDFYYNGVANYCFGDGFTNYAAGPNQFVLATNAAGQPRPMPGPQRPTICLLNSENDGASWKVNYFTHSEGTDGMRITRTTGTIVAVAGYRFTPVFFIPKWQLGQGQLLPYTVNLPFDNKIIGRGIDDPSHVFIGGWDAGVYHLIRMDEFGNYTAPELAFPAVAQVVIMQSPAFPPGGFVSGVNNLALLGSALLGDIWVDLALNKIFVLNQGACHYGTQHICIFVSQVQNIASIGPHGPIPTTLDAPVWNPMITDSWSSDVPGGEPTVDTWAGMVASSSVDGGIPAVVATQSNANLYPSMVVGFGAPNRIVNGTFVPHNPQLTFKTIAIGTGTCDTGGGVWRCEDFPGIQTAPFNREQVWASGSVPIPGTSNQPRSQGAVTVVGYGPVDCKPPLLGCPLP